MTQEQAQDFQDILTDMDSGETHRQLTDAIRRVVLAVCATKQKGKLNLSLDLSVEGQQIRVVPTITTKIPQPKPDATIFYPGKLGDLSLDNRKQLPLKNVPAKTPTELRSVPTTSAVSE